jgi:hypothetical protein
MVRPVQGAEYRWKSASIGRSTSKMLAQPFYYRHWHVCMQASCKTSTVMPPEFIVGVYLMGSDVRAFEPFAFVVWLLPCRRIIPADRNHAVIC